MRYSDFNGLKISALGLGTMRLPVTADGKIDYELSGKMVDEAIKGGVNYFDTAYKYHEGESETFCGSVLSKYPRESYLLADKLPTWLCSTVEDAEALLREQLKKCNVEYFDFYLLHNVNEETWPGIKTLGLVDFMKTVKERGLARHIGFSTHCKPELLEEILSSHGDVLEFVQIQINYMDWDYIDAKALHQIIRKYNKPVIVMEPLRGGTLANLPSPKARDVLVEASRAAGKPAASNASYGLRYASQLDGVMVTLSGMSTSAQMAENIDIFSGEPLTQTELDACHDAGKQLCDDILVPCTGCNYCYECPAGIKIPAIFKQYNDSAARNFHYVFDDMAQLYADLGANANDCLKCGNCQSHCPQNIKIIDKLREIDDRYKEEIKKGK